MSTLLDQLMLSPRLIAIHDRVASALRGEAAERAKFRNGISDDRREEFINGKVVTQVPARFGRNSTSERIYDLLKAIASRHRLGHVGHENYLVGLTRNDVIPDVAFWRAEISDKFTADQLIFPPPGLAVEVLSPSTEEIDRGIKVDDYAANGVTEYWVVDADKQIVEQYVLAGEVYELRAKAADGTLKLAAMPGVSVPVRAFFDDVENRAAIDAVR
jgi:Uma2 family endonuclease